MCVCRLCLPFCVADKELSTSTGEPPDNCDGNDEGDAGARELVDFKEPPRPPSTNGASPSHSVLSLSVFEKTLSAIEPTSSSFSFWFMILNSSKSCSTSS